VDSQRLSHYELLHRIGEGGMGEVWLARDTHLGRQLAIKMLCEDAADDAARRRLRFEARTVSALNHPHIVTVYDVGRDGGGLGTGRRRTVRRKRHRARFCRSGRAL
jgi:eukaryotic-like serine/threonine-protein kinase